MNSDIYVKYLDSLGHETQYHNENNILAMLDEIDPEYKYHLKHSSDESNLTITFPKFGKDLTHLHRPDAAWLRKFLHVFKTIELMHKHGIYHCDIKLENILYDGNEFRVIDFDLSSKSCDVLIDEFYYAWPVENIFLGSDPVHLLNFERKINYYKDFIARTEYKPDPNHIKFRECSKTCEILSKMDHDIFIKLFHKKLDTWCLGFTLSRILYNWFNHDNRKLNDLCRDMCHPDIEKRISISDATKRYDEVTRDWFPEFNNTSKRDKVDSPLPYKKSK